MKKMNLPVQFWSDPLETVGEDTLYHSHLAKKNKCMSKLSFNGNLIIIIKLY